MGPSEPLITIVVVAAMWPHCCLRTATVLRRHPFAEA